MQGEHQTPPNYPNQITINIHLSRRLAAVLIVALLAIAALALLAWGNGPAKASQLEAPAAIDSSSGMRKFYLTNNLYYGDQPEGSDGQGAGVCQPGYHFASLFELMEISNLEYDGNPAYAATRADMGDGPPTIDGGWVRTGYNDNSSTTPGNANCVGWSMRELAPGNPARGSLALLPDDWTNASEQEIHIWDVGLGSCDSHYFVWCIED